MGGIGGLFAAVFGVFWTVGASSIGAPPFMVLFGVVFVGIALVGAAMNIFNAAAKNRLSEYDITSEGEESDPIAHVLGHSSSRRRSADDDAPGLDPDVAARRGERPPGFDGGFCPYCGVRVKSDYEFCPSCGKDI